MKTTSQIAPQPAASKPKDQRTAQEPAPRQPEAHVNRAPVGSALALQRSIGNRALARLMQEGAVPQAAARLPRAKSYKGSAAGFGVVQRLPNDADTSSAAPASVPTAAGATDASASTPQPGSRPPVVFGMDTTSHRIYASVTVPGHSIAEISTYIYGTPDKAAELQARNGTPAQVQAGRNLELTDATLAPAAQQAINSAQENGTLLRSAGTATEETSGGQITVYRFTANGQAFELTQAQYQAFLTGQSVHFTRKASYFRDMLKGQLGVRDDHVNQNSRLVRGISDWMGNVEVPPTTKWTEPMGIAQAIIDELASGDITPEKIGQSALHLAIVVKGYTSASEAWHHYIEGTIAGAERTAGDLEVVRDTSFMIAAGLAGAAAVPVVLPYAGSGLAAVGVTGTTATVLGGATTIGAGALAGGAVRGGLEVVAPNPQNNAGALDRFKQQFGRGAVAGGIGAAGALAAPGVSGAVSQRLFGAAPEALTGIGARTAVGALTGLIIGIPSGALDAAINNMPALASGKISTGDYLEKVGWAAVAGAAFGTVFGAIGGALSRPKAPSSGLATQKPPAPGAASPDFVINPPRVNPATGEITQTATHLASGETVQMRFNPATGEVTMTRMSTGEVVTVRQPTSHQLPPGEVTPTGQGGTTAAQETHVAVQEGAAAGQETSVSTTSATMEEGAEIPAGTSSSDTMRGSGTPLALPPGPQAPLVLPAGPSSVPLVDPGGRGVWWLPEADIVKLPAAEAARLRTLQSAMPASEEQLTEMVGLRTRAAGGDLAPRPGTPEHMLKAWQAYQQSMRDVYQPFKTWSAGHPSRMQNSIVGPARELAYREALAQGGVRSRSAVLQTPSGQRRQVDALIETPQGQPRQMLQIKAGDESLSTQARVSGGSKRGATSLSNTDALAADHEFVKAGDQVTWAFEKSPSAPLVKRARELGVGVIIRVDNAAEQARMTALFKQRGMTEAQVKSTVFFIGDRGTFIQYVTKQFGGK